MPLSRLLDVSRKYVFKAGIHSRILYLRPSSSSTILRYHKLITESY